MLDSTDSSRNQLAWLSLAILRELAGAEKRNDPGLQTTGNIVLDPRAQGTGVRITKVGD